MQVLTATGGLASTNAFLVADEEAKQAVIFDAPDHTVTPLLDAAAERGWDVIGLWLTHGHFDHLADHQLVTDRFPAAKVLIHELDAPKLRNPKSAVFPLPFTIPPREPDGFVTDGQTLRLGGLTAQVIFTPGHSPGHVMYHFPAEKLVIGGDLIIGNAVGRTDLPDSDPAALGESVRRVMNLPPDTTLLGGHGPATMLAREAAENRFVRAIRDGRM